MSESVNTQTGSAPETARQDNIEAGIRKKPSLLERMNELRVELNAQGSEVRQGVKVLRGEFINEILEREKVDPECLAMVSRLQDRLLRADIPSGWKLRILEAMAEQAINGNADFLKDQLERSRPLCPKRSDSSNEGIPRLFDNKLSEMHFLVVSREMLLNLSLLPLDMLRTLNGLP